MAISDLGLFGPESVTWRVHGDPTGMIGGLRALYLSALHPVVMAGVALNSTYRTDPIGRLNRTGEYLAVTTYGTSEDAARVAARVRGVHRRLRAVDPDTGEERRVDEPELLLWVHCVEIDSFLSVARRGGLRLSDAEADRYVAEQVGAARLVGIDPARIDVPRDVASLRAYFEEMRPRLRATGPAYDVVRFLAAPPMPGWVRYGTPAAPSWAALATLGFATLPSWARRLYSHVPSVFTTDLGATLGVRALRTAALALPAAVREGPQYRAAKERVATVPVRRLDVVGA